MTFAEWMDQNGYSELNTASGRRALLKQYGINELDSYKANMALWNALKNELSTRPEKISLQSSSIPLLTESRLPRIIVIPEEHKQDFYMPDSDSYYAGHAGELNVNSSLVPQSTEAERRLAYQEWLKEGFDNPEVLFNPRYKHWREGISDAYWRKVITAHPEYYNRKYAKYIPKQVQSWAYNRGIREATDKAAPYAAAAVMGAFDPLSMLMSSIGSGLVNEVINEATDGKHNSWGSWISKPLNIKSELGRNLAEFSNPGGLLGGIGTSRALRGSNVSSRTPYLREKTIVGTEKPFYKQIQVKGARPHTKTIKTADKIALNDPDAVIPNRPQYTTNLDIIHDVYGTKTINISKGKPHVRTVLKFPRLVGENAANFGLNAPVVSWLPSENNDQLVSLPQQSTINSYKEWKFPEINYYNTARDWGSADFQEWWKQNATEENAGKTLNYNGKPIKITWDPNGYRVRNLAGKVAAGLYPSGQVTDKLVLNRPPITYTGDRIGYQLVGVTPAVFVSDQNEYGETITMKTGGKLNYFDYL